MKSDYKILITGGSGILGTEILKLLKNSNFVIFSPSSQELNISDFSSCREWFDLYKPNLIIHLAAFTDVKSTEKKISKSINSNIIGTANMVLMAERYQIKLVHISTDYVFDGKKGNYSISDFVNPISKYAKSKTAAEFIVKMYDNSLIIRTSFFPRFFPYEKAFVDQFTTKDYVDIMAPKILQEALSEKIGIVHCFSKKRSIYDIAIERKKDVIKSFLDEENFKIPKDTSLI